MAGRLLGLALSINHGRITPDGVHCSLTLGGGGVSTKSAHLNAWLQGMIINDRRVHLRLSPTCLNPVYRKTPAILLPAWLNAKTDRHLLQMEKVLFHSFFLLEIGSFFFFFLVLLISSCTITNIQPQYLGMFQNIHTQSEFTLILPNLSHSISASFCVKSYIQFWFHPWSPLQPSSSVPSHLLSSIPDLHSISDPHSIPASQLHPTSISNSVLIVSTLNLPQEWSKADKCEQ